MWYRIIFDRWLSFGRMAGCLVSSGNSSLLSLPPNLVYRSYFALWANPFVVRSPHLGRIVVGHRTQVIA